MISDARGGHVSPGIYTEERDVVYSAKSLGITSCGLVGETLKGPAFQPIAIEDWADFVDYFGGTSPEKYKGTGYPKYELPYIAKSYLSESRNLTVCRVLGLSGYNAGKAWVVKFTADGKSYPVVVLRSKGSYNKVSGNDVCSEADAEAYTDNVTNITLGNYVGYSYDSKCQVSKHEETVNVSGTGNKVDGKFQLVIDDVKYNVSLNPSDRDYIYKMFSVDPLVGSANVYIEAVYDKAYNDVIDSLNPTVIDKEGEVISSGSSWSFGIEGLEEYKDYKEPFRAAATPWIVSEVKYASSEVAEMKKLFKFYTIADGNSSNYQVKVSIQNIKPDEGTFDVIVRDFYDNDSNPLVLEKFAKCTMVEGNPNFIGLRIGTIDGLYENRSKYIAVMVSNEEGVEECVPAGFLGYPIPKYNTTNGVNVAYNTMFDTSVKARRQYFGLNSNILDEDILNYKGVNAYANMSGDANPELLTRGFHLDAILNRDNSEISNATIKVDGQEGYVFETVSPLQNIPYAKIPRILTESYMEDTLYADVNTRKFTVYPYGGFDGWDIHRAERTNGDDYKATKYQITETENRPFDKIGGGNWSTNPIVDLGLPSTAITSDYYAYLGGYKQFANPQEIDINVFATPGIDFVNNTLLVDDVIDMIEDPEDGRGGDALYIFTTPQCDADGNEYSADEVVDLLEYSDIDTSYAATYFPWIKYYDKEYQMYLNLPVTKDVMKNLASTDNTSYPWFAPAGVTRGVVDCVRAYKKTTLAEEDTLYDGRINPVKTFGADGVKIWGNKTAYTKETPLNRINVRRLMIRVKKLIVNASKSLIFEQYDASLEKQFRAIVEPILSDVQSNRGIADFRVITECTAETRDQHILPAKILIKPIGALEYISISFTVYPESVSFDE